AWRALNCQAGSRYNHGFRVCAGKDLHRVSRASCVNSRLNRVVGRIWTHFQHVVPHAAKHLASFKAFDGRTKTRLPFTRTLILSRRPLKPAADEHRETLSMQECTSAQFDPSQNNSNQEQRAYL